MKTNSVQRYRDTFYQSAWSLLCAGTLLVSLVSENQAQPPADGFELIEATIADVHAAIRAKEITCQDLTRAYIDRIGQLDDSSRLNAIVAINPLALARAAELDRSFVETGVLLPLHGIPVIVKDNYDMVELPTTAGSMCLKGTIPPDDAFQIRKLREAGAVLLCKSNMAEFAYSPLFTVNSIAGTTRNPYDLDRVPAGSSGGTAASVAANFGMVGLGTDTGNSIRGPASHCCLVGLRPTLGLTSRDGIVPLFLRNDVGGPMCRTVADAARVLQVIAGHDPADPITAKCQGRIAKSYLELLDIDSLKGSRIGVFRTLSQTKTADREIARLFEHSLSCLAAQGATIIDPFEIPGLNGEVLSQAQSRLWRDTFARDIQAYLASLGNAAPVHDIEQIVKSGKFHESVKDRLANSARQVHRDLPNPSSADPADDPLRAELLEAVIGAMDAAKIDAFVFPTWNNPPRKVGDLRSPDGNNCFQIPPHTGQPAITVPMGFTESDLPAGLQFVGRPFSEARILSLAYAFEQATRHRKPPTGFGLED